MTLTEFKTFFEQEIESLKEFSMNNPDEAIGIQDLISHFLKIKKNLDSVADHAWKDINEPPEPYDQVLVNFNQCHEHQGADMWPKFKLVAWRDPANEWNLYQLYHSVPIRKDLLIPTHWMPLPCSPK